MNIPGTGSQHHSSCRAPSRAGLEGISVQSAWKSDPSGQTTAGNQWERPARGLLEQLIPTGQRMSTIWKGREVHFHLGREAAAPAKVANSAFISLS